MSAMQIINELKEQGARITGFRSYCGGLVAPESEGNNPWRYKFTWNPRNVVLAGQGGPAHYLESGQEKYLPYEELFGRAEWLAVPGHGHFEGYANRDSLAYREVYGLADVQTMLRGTLRRPGYCPAWQVLVTLGFTDDTTPLGNPATLFWQALVAQGLGENVPVDNVASHLAEHLNLDPHGPELDRLAWLGLFTKRQVGLANATRAQLLEYLLADKWQLGPHDRDQVVMQHQFDYEVGGQLRRRTSSLVVTGTDATHTAMAQTVGLPLGMAVRRLARGEIKAHGVVIPTQAELYQPILAELAADYGLAFQDHDEPIAG